MNWGYYVYTLLFQETFPYYGSLKNSSEQFYPFILMVNPQNRCTFSSILSHHCSPRAGPPVGPSWRYKGRWAMRVLSLCMCITVTNCKPPLKALSCPPLAHASCCGTVREMENYLQDEDPPHNPHTNLCIPSFQAIQ